MESQVVRRLRCVGPTILATIASAARNTTTATDADAAGHASLHQSPAARRGLSVVSGRAKSLAGPARRKLDVQRVRVDAQGYDASGAYWGAGQDVFIVTTPDGREEMTVRAGNAAEARAKATSLLLKTEDGTGSKRQRIGGASPHKSRYQIDWQDPATGRSVRLRITHARNYLSHGSDHLEVESLKPIRAPLPITETGYRSHFLPGLELINAGGPVTFVTAWLDREAESPKWRKAQSSRSQGDLFRWAETRDEATKRSPVKSRRRNRLTTAPDPDYIADLEQSQGAAATAKRMKQRERGRPVAKPKGLG